MTTTIRSIVEKDAKTEAQAANAIKHIEGRKYDVDAELPTWKARTYVKNLTEGAGVARFYSIYPEA